MTFISGARLTTDDTNDHKEDLRDALDWLSPKQDGIAFLKKIGLKGFTFSNPKFEYTEDALAPRRQTITTDNVATSIAVTDSTHIPVDSLMRVEDEIMRVTGKADGTHITVTRGYGATAAAAHTAKSLIRLGTARPENSDPLDGVTSNATKLYNYQQLFERNVEMSNDEYDQLTTAGNMLSHQLKMRMVEIMQELSASLWYGVRAAVVVSGKTVYSMGGINQFLTTNVTNAAGALTVALIDARIKEIVDAGGNPDCIVLSTTQKMKLDALDTAKQLLSKSEHTGGGLVTTQYQCGVMDGTLQVIVDHTLNPDELYVLDTSKIKIGYKVGKNGHRGFKQEDVTPIGRDGVKFAIRGKYSVRVDFEKGLAKLYGLTV